MASLPRLGEILIEAGAITQSQLGEALAVQRQHGGRLGTNLVELGFIDEKALAGLLARQLSIPSATAAQLDRCDAQAIALLPAQAADRLRAVPLREDNGKLWVAMADPTDVVALGELGKLTGRTVRPMVAPELLIQYALERHYHVQRKPRVMQVKTGGTGLLSFDGSRTPVVPGGAAPLWNAYAGQESSGDVDDFAGYLDDDGEREPPPPRRTLREIAAELVAAGNDEAIFQVAMRHLAADVQRLAVFVLRNGLLAGWRGIGVDTALLKRTSVALAEAPVVARTLASGEAWVGRLHARDLGELGAPLVVRDETLAVVLPVRIGKRAVALIVGVEATLEALRQKGELDKLAIKLDQALHISYLRRLLLATP